MIELNPNDVSKLNLVKNQNVTQMTEEIIQLANTLPNEYASQMLQDLISNLEEMKRQLDRSLAYGHADRQGVRSNHIHPGINSKDRSGI